MKLILIVLIIAQIYGAFSINIPLEGQRSPIAFPVAQGTDTGITAVSNAVTDAIHHVTLWMGDKLDARLNLLTELKSFQLGLQQSMVEITQSSLNGTITTEYRPLLSKLNFFLKIHLNTINNMITILIPTMEDSTATQAITSCLDVAQLIKEAIEKIHVLFSS